MKRPWLVLAAALLLGLAALYFLRVERVAPNALSSTPQVASVPVETRNNKSENTFTGTSPIADTLNSPASTIRHDLELLNEVFGAWQTNFPRDGNPVGENSEITATLAGRNKLRFAFIAPKHPAINARGELCDRWGTPFFFHQLSATQMEIRSAGPDQKFWTNDDVLFTP